MSLHFNRPALPTLCCLFSICLLALSSAARGQLEPSGEAELQPVFADVPQEVSVVFRNGTASRQVLSIAIRIFQMSSSTLMPIDKAHPWKEIEILPGQTVLESAVVRLPPVKVATYFQIQWLGDDGQVLSKSRLFAVPKDIARSLSTITSNATTGLLDPENRIKPLFKEQNIDFEDLIDEDGLARFKGRLAILFLPPDQGRSKELAELIARKSHAGTAIIATGLEEPSMSGIVVRLIRPGDGGVLLADSALFKNLTTSARSQLNLIRFATLMLNPQQFPLLSTLQ
jgi:hypothetical protein